MLRRALALTGLAVAVSAACAFAFSPLARAGRTWTRGMLGFEAGFTPVPPNAHSLADDSVTFRAQGGVPGTYCPTPARNGVAKQPATADEHVSLEQTQSSVAPPTPDGKGDLLLPTRPAICNVPTAAAPAARSILP